MIQLNSLSPLPPALCPEINHSHNTPRDKPGKIHIPSIHPPLNTHRCTALMPHIANFTMVSKWGSLIAGQLPLTDKQVHGNPHLLMVNQFPSSLAFRTRAVLTLPVKR